MNLQGWKKYRSQIAWGIVFLLVAGFVTRVAIWEKHYYESKEGSERPKTQIITEIEVDETEITPAQRTEYNVAPGLPRYLTISKIGITNARIFPVKQLANGEISTPRSIFDVGWYNQSGKPGAGGTMLLDGHNGGPTKVGVFKYLPDLVPGDLITVQRGGDNTVFTYEVVENQTYSIKEANRNMYKMLESPVKGKESLSIITCTGEWSQIQKTYLSRQLLRAVLK